MKYSVEIRDAQNDAMRSTVGAAPVLEVWSGAEPAGVDDADAGELIAAGALPDTWLAPSSGGQVSAPSALRIVGTPAAAGGKRGGYFRVKQGPKTHLQGSYSDANGAGEMRAKSATIAAGQSVLIESFTIVRGNK